MSQSGSGQSQAVEFFPGFKPFKVKTSGGVGARALRRLPRRIDHRSRTRQGGFRQEAHLPDVRGHGTPSAHWLPEQIPEQVVKEVTAFIDENS